MIGIKIIYEDDSFLVLDKPAGITVNRSETTKGDTLQDYLEEKFNIPVERSGIVHRIDKETSGLLLIAKNNESFASLQKQFKDRLVKKTYITLVHGDVKADGVVNVPVGRLPWARTKFGVLAGGREAVTKFKVIGSQIMKNEHLTLLEVYPETGRTHQIRVHMKYVGHPIFGDELYAGRKTARSDRKILPRLFLHASKISFAHPTSGEGISFESKLPEELKRVLDLAQIRT